MTNTWNKAGGLLLGCVVALGSAACDDGGGKTTSDAGSQDSGSQDSGSQDSGSQDSGSQDAGSDASVPTNATVRLAHLAYGVGTPNAGPPPTTLVHVCVETTKVSDGSEAVPPILFTVSDADPSPTVGNYTAKPLPYMAISGYATAPTYVLNSTASLTRTAQVWAAADIDTTMIGTGATATCRPINGTAQPITEFVIPQGGFVAGSKYTIVVTGRIGSDCLDTSGSAVTCPAPAINVINDDTTAPTTGTAWRIINASTTYAAGSSCFAHGGAADAVAGGITTGIAPLIPNPAMTLNPLPVFRVGSTGTGGAPVLNTPYVPGANITSATFTAGPNTLPDTLFSSMTATTTCPAKIMWTGTSTATDLKANGSLPQDAAISGNYSGGVAATAVGNAGTTNGDVVSVFIVDYPNPLGGANPPVPLQILIDDNP